MLQRALAAAADTVQISASARVPALWPGCWPFW